MSFLEEVTDVIERQRLDARCTGKEFHASKGEPSRNWRALWIGIRPPLLLPHIVVPVTPSDNSQELVSANQWLEVLQGLEHELVGFGIGIVFRGLEFCISGAGSIQNHFNWSGVLEDQLNPVASSLAGLKVVRSSLLFLALYPAYFCPPLLHLRIGKLVRDPVQFSISGYDVGIE
jgi:hypothetical protein